jgi:ribose transport system substrate-binding protein
MKLKKMMLLCAALLLAACTQQAGPGGANTANGGGGTGGAKRLAFVTNNASDFWTIARKGVEKADAELPGVTAEFKIPSDGTAAEQKRIVDDLLAKGIDGIAMSPVDPDNQTGLINEVSQKTLVFTQDSDAPNSSRACYVGTDNVEAGRQAGGLIKEALPQGGKIMVFVGKLDARNAAERLQGIKESLQGSNVTIIDTRTDDTDRVRAKSNVADTLVKYPEVVGLVGLWSYNGPAIVNAVRDAGTKVIKQAEVEAFTREINQLRGR